MIDWHEDDDQDYDEDDHDADDDDGYNDDGDDGDGDGDEEDGDGDDLCELCWGGSNFQGRAHWQSNRQFVDQPLHGCHHYHHHHLF